DKLPDSPFRGPEDPPGQHIVDLDELPHLGRTVRLAAVAQSGAFPQRVSSVEFGPLGETTRSAPTAIWLAAGPDSDARYVVLTVDPITGLVDVGDYTRNGPPAALLPD
ncbi:MAG: hypothetical protein GTN77_10755, partial [Planctomycetales bacterium]|nr:hypothetical protein [Planctomycetales bacterium]